MLAFSTRRCGAGVNLPHFVKPSTDCVCVLYDVMCPSHLDGEPSLVLLEGHNKGPPVWMSWWGREPPARIRDWRGTPHPLQPGVV